MEKIMGMCADGKAPMREAAVECLDRSCTYGEPETAKKPGKDAKGKDCEVEYLVYNEVDKDMVKLAMKGMCSKEEGLVKEAARGPLLEWGALRFKALPVGTDMKDLIPYEITRNHHPITKRICKHRGSQCA